MIAIIAGYALCGIVAWGGVMADFWFSYPILQSDDGRWRELSGRAAFFALLGPFGLLVSYLCSGFYRHGLIYRQPCAAPRRTRKEP